MKKTIAALAFIFLMPSFFLTADSCAEEGAAILFIEGDVKIKLKDAAEWKAAEEGMVLLSGDSVKTEKDSWVELGFGADFKNAVKLGGDSAAELDSLMPVKIGLLNGDVRSLIESLDAGSTFVVRTPTAVCGARGTGWDIYTDGARVTADVYENNIFFNPLSAEGDLLEEVLVQAGKSAVIEGPGKPVSLADIPLDKLEAWASWKKDFLAKLLKEMDSIKDKMKEYERPVKDKAYSVTADPRFRDAVESYDKATRYLEKGDKIYRTKQGEAKKSYEHAEDYLLDAAFKYKELGVKYGVDTSKEVAECDALQRKVHVKVNKLGRSMRRSK